MKNLEIFHFDTLDASEYCLLFFSHFSIPLGSTRFSSYTVLVRKS